MMMRSAWSALEIGQASAVTLGHRLPMLAAAPFFPEPETLAEINRMITEKVAATLEGSFAAAGETTALALRAAIGRAGPMELATAMLTITEAVTKPVHRRVRANAKRLSR